MPAEAPGHALLEAELEPGDPGAVALRWMDALLAERPHKEGHDFSACVRHLCALRRRLVAELHGGGADPALRARLGRLNGVISAVVGGQFPLGPVPWPQVEAARGELAALLGV